MGMGGCLERRGRRGGGRHHPLPLTLSTGQTLPTPSPLRACTTAWGHRRAWGRGHCYIRMGRQREGSERWRKFYVAVKNINKQKTWFGLRISDIDFDFCASVFCVSF